ncbi:MAG: DnaJ domain-containing protein [Fimbriimonadaceae bacterium]|nr:DnaJ domain-containing protein [Fimbriimonadaceae bacterium]QYK55900.1 MAG: DnaJ domain-containing protein [Fimbriimonadaceae bacterium]
MPTLYEILGLETKAQPAEVRTAYRRLARTYHPDVNDDPASHDKMAKINAAFEVLSDPVRRMEYDALIGTATFEEPSGETAGRNPDAIRATIIHRARGHKTPIYGLSYAPGTGRLLSCSFDNEIFWWNEEMTAAERSMRLEGGVVSSVVALDDSRAVVAGCTEQQLGCWRIDGTKFEVWRQVPKDWVVTVLPSPDGNSLALGTVTRQARVVGSRDGAVRFTCDGHADAVTALAWSSDSRYLASGSADATVKLWDGRTGSLVYTFDQVRSTVTSLAFSPDGHWIAVAAVDLSIRVFDVHKLQLRKTFFGHDRPVEALAFHPRSWLLASASRDGSMGLWNVVHGVNHGRAEASLQPLSAVAFSPDGRHVSAGGLDKVLRVWRLSSPK